MLIGNQPESNKENDHFEKYLHAFNPSYKVESSPQGFSFSKFDLQQWAISLKEQQQNSTFSRYFINHWIRIDKNSLWLIYRCFRK